MKAAWPKRGECAVPTAERAGPNDYFEISSNNTPDPPDDDDTVIEPQDYAGDYPLEGEDGDDC